MIQKSLLAILVFLLCAALLQGMPTSSRGRCLCRGGRLPRVNMQDVAEIQFHQPSRSCDQEELIVVLKRNGQRRCLNTDLNQGRRIKEAIMKK